MTRQEVRERYNIPSSVLEEYEKWGLCGAGQACGARQYDDTDLERLGMMMALYEIGFAGEAIERYMRLLSEQKEGEDRCLRMLEEKRKEMLEEIHFQEQQLARLDFWRHQLRNGKKE